MSPTALAELVLTIHVTVVFFIVSGLVAIPLGARLGWPIAGWLWYRMLHLSAITLVALQKFLGKLCFLSVWEFDLLRDTAHGQAAMRPLFVIGDRLIHWNMPLWFFTALYAIVWLYVAWLWYRFPPNPGLKRPSLHPSGRAS